MTVKDLKEMISDMPDDMPVYIPMNPSKAFDGLLFSPCVEESGKSAFAVEELEEIERKQNLGLPLNEEDAFLLVPCGYSDKKHEEEIPLN